MQLLKNSIRNTISSISQNFNKVNNRFYDKSKAINICFEKIITNKLLLNYIDFDLINKFSLLTSFHD